MMNLVLFGSTKRFTSLPRDLFSWPSIQLEELTYQPVLRHKGIPLAKSDVYEEAPCHFQFNKGVEIRHSRSTALDSTGNIIAETKEGILSVINTITGTTKIIHSFSIKMPHRWIIQYINLPLTTMTMYTS